MTTELQMLVTGAILGSLMRAPEVGLNVDTEAIVDADGYTGQIKVTGRESGETVLVAVMAEADMTAFQIITAPATLEVVDGGDDVDPHPGPGSE